MSYIHIYQHIHADRYTVRTSTYKYVHIHTFYTYAFDYPAEFKLDHEEITHVVCFTATYTGQAIKGELIEIAGQVEQASDGLKRIVVGSSREALGEYIKVIHA